MSRTAVMRASGVVTSSMFTVASAPNLRASFSRGSSGAPTQITRPAPISCAAAIARMPIGPEPWMTTVSPHLKPPAAIARLKARMQEVSGSDSAPSRRLMSSGSL